MVCKFLGIGLVLGTLAASGTSSAQARKPVPDRTSPALARSFELVYYSSNPVFSGRTSFREWPGKPEMTTDQRIEYLRLLADRLAREGGRLVDQPVVSEEMIRQAKDRVRPAPLPKVRIIQPLDLWKWQIDVKQEAAGTWSAYAYDDWFWNAIRAPYVREVSGDLWFRTRVQPPATPRVWLEFEQLVDECWVFVNGRQAIHHEGYGPFCVDITSLLKQGEGNSIALRIPAKAGEQVGIGGYVRLIGTGDQKIEKPFVYTKSISETGGRATAEISVSCRIKNWAVPFTGSLAVALRPRENGAVAATTARKIQVSTNGEQGVELVLQLSGARLWTPVQPDLYEVRLELSDAAGRRVDDIALTAGVRTVEQRAGRFFLNGKPFFMVGFLDTMNYAPKALASSHSEIAPSDEQIIRTILGAKAAHANTLRLTPLGMKTPEREAANGWPPFSLMTDGTNYSRYAELADQLGIGLIWTSRFWGWQMSMLNAEDREIQVTRDLPVSLEAVRNHPSILVWEGMNEVSLVLHRGLMASTKPNPRLEANIELYKKLRAAYLATVNAVDKSRLINPDSSWVESDENHPGLYPALPAADLADPKIYQTIHLYYGWYKPTAAIWTLPGLCDPKTRDRAFVVQELGAEAMPRWDLYREEPWYGIWVNNAARYGAKLETDAIGRPLRVLDNSEYRLSQAYQALLFQAYATAIRNYGGNGFTVCTIADGFARGMYHKGVLDVYNRAKLGWFMARIVMDELFPTGTDGDAVLSPSDALKLKISSTAAKGYQDRTLVVRVTDASGREIDEKRFPVPALAYGISEVGNWSPRFQGDGFYFLDYELR